MTTRRPTLVLVGIATVALLFGATGGAVAGGMVTGKQIKNESVTGKDVKNRSLKITDLSASTVAALHGANGINGINGTNGSTGAPGAPGPSGSPGQPGVSGYDLVADFEDVAAATPATMELDCPAAKKLVGAAGFWDSSSDAVQVVFKDEDTASVYTPGVPAADTLFIQVVCVTANGARTDDTAVVKGSH